MPVVPKPENFSVMPQMSSGGGFRNPMSEGMATLPGQQIAAMGAAIQRSGAEFGHMFAQIQDDVNNTRVQEAQTEAMGVINGLTTNKDRTGYADKSGKDALPGPDGKAQSEIYGKQYDDAVKGIGDRLGNDAQRGIFGAWAATKRAELTAKIDSHSATEYGSYRDSVDDAAMAAAGNTIAARYNDPDAVGEGLGGIAGAVAKKAARAGLAPEWAAAETKKQQSASLAQVADTLINQGRLKDADDFRKRHAAYFTAEQDMAVAAKLKTETDIGLMQKSVSDASAAMLKRNGGQGGPGRAGYMTEAEFIHQSIHGLGKDAAPSLVEQVTSMAGRQYHMLTSSIQDSRHHAVSAAFVGLENNGGSYYDLAPDVRAAIPDDEVEAVKAHADTITNGPVESDPVVYQQLSDDKTLGAMSDPAFQRISLQSLSPADRTVFAARRAELRDPTKADNGPGSIDRESLDSAVGARLEALGISPDPDEGDTAAMGRVGAIRKQIADTVLRQQAILGRKQDADGILKIVDDQFLKAGSFRDGLLAAPWAHDRAVGFADRTAGRADRPHLRLDPITTDGSPDAAATPDSKEKARVARMNAANETMRSRFSTFTHFPLLGEGFHINFKDKTKPNEGVGTFGMVREDGQRAHQGLDLKAPEGTPIVAVGTGKIVRTGFDPDGYGYYIQIDHGNHLYSFYGHLEKGSLPAIGTPVNAGDTIAHVGRTGNLKPDIDSHLHFELRTTLYPPKGLKGRIDPMPYLYPLHWRYNGDSDH